MKLAVIGNSHAGCLKRAWDRIETEYPGVSIVFFASGSDSMGDLKREGHRLVPGTERIRQSMILTSNGLETVELADYDAILFVGLRAQPIFLPKTEFYSSQVLAACAQAATEGQVYFDLLREVAGVFSGPIYIAHRPLRAMRQRKRASQDNRGYFRGIEVLNEMVLAPMGAKMCSQPETTIVNGCNTAEIYTAGSKRLYATALSDENQHDEGDRGHMNDAFGELWLRKFFKENLSADAAAGA